MSRAHTKLVFLLTLAYLVVELAFNARLLDVAGSLEVAEVGQLEDYGRLLSGVAVALFVLQRQLGRRDKSGGRSPGWAAIVARCGFACFITVMALKWVTTFLVDNTSGDFRKTAINLTMLRTELLEGRAQLAKKTERLDDFSGPDGKAFAALFPAMGMMMWSRLDDRLDPIRRQVFTNAINARLGGAEHFYKHAYDMAMFNARQLYEGRLPEPEFQILLGKTAEQIWSEYEEELQRRGWSTTYVPYLARNRVWRYMHAKAGVPKGWRLNDRLGMERSLDAHLRKQLAASPGTVFRDGKVVARGLSWTRFVAYPAIQKSLQNHLNTALRVRASYRSGAEFERLFYKPFLAERVARELDRLNKPAREFEAEGEFSDEGREAAQAVLIPPIALFCSLLGAMAHLAKILYLSVCMGGDRGHSRTKLAGFKVLIPIAGMGLMLWGVVVGQTPLTQGAVHQFIREQIVSDGGWGEGAMFTAMHMVEVGQYHSWPFTNSLRRIVLQGFEFR